MLHGPMMITRLETIIVRGICIRNYPLSWPLAIFQHRLHMFKGTLIYIISDEKRTIFWRALCQSDKVCWASSYPLSQCQLLCTMNAMLLSDVMESDRIKPIYWMSDMIPTALLLRHHFRALVKAVFAYPRHKSKKWLIWYTIISVYFVLIFEIYIYIYD